MGKSMPPVEVRKMMYEKAVNRCVVAKGDTMKNMKLNRAAVGQVVTYWRRHCRTEPFRP